jgi:hypothetical protein
MVKKHGLVQSSVNSMYRNALMAIIIAATSATCYAQNFGFKGGLVTSTITGQGALAIKPGVQLGGYIRLGADAPLFLQTELLITQKGTWNWNSNVKNQVDLIYLELPVMYSIEVYSNIVLNFGIQPAMLLSGRHTFTDSEQNEVTIRGNNMSRFDYALIIGAEYELKPGLMLGLRYSNSMIPLQGYDSEFYKSNILPRLKVFQFYVAIPLDKIKIRMPTKDN